MTRYTKLLITGCTEVLYKGHWLKIVKAHNKTVVVGGTDTTAFNIKIPYTHIEDAR